jgi:hypothetical protein
MTPIEFLAAVPIIAFISFIWGALQTEEVNATAYKQNESNLWVETKTKVIKPSYPNISDPVLPDKPMK